MKCELSKAKMLEILKRQNEESEDELRFDSDDEEDLEERMEGTCVIL